MLHGESPPPGDSFDEKLRSLRLRIDSLPEEHRPRLIELADAIAQQHRHSENRKPRRHDADRDSRAAD